MFVSEFAKGEFARPSAGALDHAFRMEGVATFEAVGSFTYPADWSVLGDASVVAFSAWLRNTTFNATGSAIAGFVSDGTAEMEFQISGMAEAGFVGSWQARTRFDEAGYGDFVAGGSLIRPATLGVTGAAEATWRASWRLNSAFEATGTATASWQQATSVRESQFNAAGLASASWRSDPLQTPSEVILRGGEDRLIYWR